MSPDSAILALIIVTLATSLIILMLLSPASESVTGRVIGKDTRSDDWLLTLDVSKERGVIEAATYAVSPALWYRAMPGAPITLSAKQCARVSR